MHYRVFVTVSIDNCNTSRAARQFVYEYLHEEGFVDGYKRFGGAWGDWFVIGGRWTGELTTAVNGTVPEAELPVPATTIAETQTCPPGIASWAAHYWQSEHQPDDTPLRQRSDYKSHGFEDDARVVNQELYDLFLKEYEGSEQEMAKFVDVDGDIVSPDFIGGKWLVVIDLHC